MEKELYHYGVKGMKWGVRRYQNSDGTRTAAGKKRDSFNNKLNRVAESGKNFVKKHGRTIAMASATGLAVAGYVCLNNSPLVTSVAYSAMRSFASIPRKTYDNPIKSFSGETLDKYKHTTKDVANEVFRDRTWEKQTAEWLEANGAKPITIPEGLEWLYKIEEL